MILLVNTISSYGEYSGFEFEIVKQDECFDITQICQNSTYSNITSIVYPNMTKIPFSPEQNMTKSGPDYTFHTCNFSSQLGYYHVNGHCDSDDYEYPWMKTYIVTFNGKEPPEGIVIIFFLIIFLIIIASLGYLMIYTIIFFVTYNFEKRHAIDAKSRSFFGIYDLVFNFSAYGVLLCYFLLSRHYLGSQVVNTYMPMILFFTTITNIVFPIIAFIISIGLIGWNAVLNTFGGKLNG